MNEKIIRVIDTFIPQFDDDAASYINTRLIKMTMADEIEHLVNQEVERRIAERMPSEEERRAAASEHEHKESFGYSEMDKLTGLYRNIDFEAGADWACSRLTNPGDSQKTEGGGE